MRPLFTATFGLVAPIALIACSGAQPGNSQPVAPGATATPDSPDAKGDAAALPFKVQVVADFDAPWSMTFLPDGRMLVTEKQGQLVLLGADGKNPLSVSGVPKVESAGQGALKEILLAPDYATSKRVYFTYSEAGEGGNGLVLARATLVDGAAPALNNVETLFRASHYVSGGGHYSARVAFAPDGKHLFLTSGERMKFDPSQDPKSTLGKVLRLTLDGKPAGDPGLVAKGFHPAVWSYGHRNLLGIAFDAQGNLWQQEMGPKHGDELNLVLPGRNYGYPIVSNGDHYDGRPIPDHSTRPEFEAPKVTWVPAISPAGLMIYSGKMFPQWKGDAFLGGLSSKALIRVDLNGTNAAKGDQWPMGARIREVEEGPDGAIWLLEDGGQGSQGRLLKLTR